MGREFIGGGLVLTVLPFLMGKGRWMPDTALWAIHSLCTPAGAGLMFLGSFALAKGLFSTPRGDWISRDWTNAALVIGSTVYATIVFAIYIGTRTWEIHLGPVA
jgi:hypothetical protein